MRAAFPLILTLATLAAADAAAQEAAAPVRPSTRAAAVAGDISLDGRLDERAWAAVEPARDFRQQDPREGEPASQPTEVRFLYDESAFYIGARMYDELGAAGVRTRLARRDDTSDGDFIMFIFDTFHDHTGRTILQVTPSGVKYDAGQASASADPSWDPIWEVSTRTDSLGWTAEIRVPFAQLRFPADSIQTWGMQIWRYVERLNEISMWSFWGKQEPGGAPMFGHLEGVMAPVQKLGMEIMPYVVARLEDITPNDPTNPFLDDRTHGFRLGGDVKALLTSTLTLDATINPDFGQVEVDPAVVNLSAFETFFPEKRPFFVEGSGLFGFGSFNCFFCSNVSSLSLFYSRRIGRQPQGFVSEPSDYVNRPENTTILGAAKVTGRTRGGLQVGLLNAVTASEKAEAIFGGERFEREVEPFTNYFVGRLRQNMMDGDLSVGAMVTSVLRRFENADLEALLPARAEAIGFDWRLAWAEQAYSIMGNFALSQVTGDSLAMQRVQRSSARYFQRPDREQHGNGFLTNRYDTSLTALRGIGGYARIAKDAGDWLWEASANIRTPAFEVNDLAFLTRADYNWFSANLFRNYTKPTPYYRYLNLIAGTQQQFNYDGDWTEQDYHVYAGTQLPNYWSISSFLIVWPEVLDDRLTRGGPVVRHEGSWSVFGNLDTDNRKKVVLSTNPRFGMDASGARDYSVNLGIRFKPAPFLTASLSPSFSHGESSEQFVASFADPSATDFYGRRVVFAGLTQNTLSLDTRLSAVFTPELTLEVFAQPFVSAGQYSTFKQFDRPRTAAKTAFTEDQITPVRANGRDVAYVLDPDRDPNTANFQFSNPDFNFRSLRGNAVLRWEYRPGSTLFFVWQQTRSNADGFGDFDFQRDAAAPFRERPDNVFLVKATYWFGG